MTCRSTFTPVCLVYCSARACQKGRVWSLLYSAITTLMDWGLSPPQPPGTSAAAPRRTRARKPRRVIEPILQKFRAGA